MNGISSHASEQEKIGFVSNTNPEGEKHSNLYNGQLINILDNCGLISLDKSVLEPLGTFNIKYIVPILYDHSTTTQKLDDELIDYMQSDTVPPSLKTIFKFIKKTPEIGGEIENLKNKFTGLPHEKNTQISRLLHNYRELYRQRLNKGGIYVPKRRPEGKRTDKDRTSGEYTVMSNIITLLLLLQENNSIN